MKKLVRKFAQETRNIKREFPVPLVPSLSAPLVLFDAVEMEMQIELFMPVSCSVIN